MAIYGIDFGTSYCSIAYLDDQGNPVIVPNQADSSDTLASAVYFESPTNVIVGNSAKDMAETEGSRVVQFVKRGIGKAEDAVPEARTREFDGKTYTPVEISSLILKRLKRMVEEQGQTVRDVVIAIPCYWGFEEHIALRELCELAGLNLAGVIVDATAAALSYCTRQFQEERTIMVYDLGGTFGVTVVKMSMVTNEAGEEAQTLKILAVGGNDRQGGKDWDDILYGMIENVCCEESGIPPEDLEPESKQAIRSKVETVKKKLTNAERARVHVDINGAMTAFWIYREDFEWRTAALAAQTMAYMEDVLAKAGNPRLDLVLLVGGATLMPMIRKAVEERFPDIPVNLHEPNQAVAKGAAIYGGLLEGRWKAQAADLTMKRPQTDGVSQSAIKII